MDDPKLARDLAALIHDRGRRQLLDLHARRAFERLDIYLRPIEGRRAPVGLRAEVQLVELIIRESVRREWGSSDLYPRRLKYLASVGHPLGICMGPVCHDGVLAPRAGLGCGRVFEQRGNRAGGFPVWCPTCNKTGQPAARELRSLVQWGETIAAWDETGQPEHARELWRLVDVEQRRSGRR